LYREYLKYFCSGDNISAEKGKEELKLFILYNYPGAEIVENEETISYVLSDKTSENIVNY